MLTAFFALATLFIGLMFLDVSLLPYPRLFAVYAENTVLALASVLLLQFAYRFPQQFPSRKWEARIALIASLAYLVCEAQYMVLRYTLLLGQGMVIYRHERLDYANAVILLWVPIAFVRQSIAADPRPVHWLRKLWNPHGKEARGTRVFVLVFGIIFLLAIVNLLRAYNIISTGLYNVFISIGTLTALWLFSSNYINFIPGGASVLAKLSILTLTLYLAILGSIGWIIAPPYIDTYRPNLKDHQTFRFTPNAFGGYDVTLTNFHFETELGDRLDVQAIDIARNQRIDFSFPFYGQTYTEVYAVSSGAISMGEPLWHPNMQADQVGVPAIFPLMVDLDPEQGGGLYARVEEDRLILTWDHLPAVYRPEAVYTFQVVLYRNGVFDITYNGLPLPIAFNPDDKPSANPWVRGATPGRGESIHTSEIRLSEPIPPGQLVIIENYHLDFRRYVHRFIVPLAWTVVGGGMVLMLILPLLLRYSIIRPLNALSAGVHQMEAGNLSVEIPIQSQDEIGFLTSAFNRMTLRLNDLVTGLEERVAERTSALTAQNAELDAFAHTVAHDLKSPISTIIGFSSMLAEDSGLLSRQDVSESASHILQTALKLNRIMDELMLLTGVRKQEVTLESLNMRSIVEEVIARLEMDIQEAGAQITLIDGASWPTVLGYAPWVEEIWVNYISNAIKYGGCPPIIELGAELVSAPPNNPPTMARFWVRDRGPGLSAESQSRLFTPFTRLDQARAKGHGLGLSIVLRIAEKLGGEVGVESELGQGSTFFFTLPVAPDANQLQGISSSGMQEDDPPA